MKDSSGRITFVKPGFAIPGGEIEIECEGIALDGSSPIQCKVGGADARIVGASSSKVLAIVPDESTAGRTEVKVDHGDASLECSDLVVGEKLTGDLHQVANPAIDPEDDSVILTRSGSRGQELPITLFRLDEEGSLHELSAKVMNPTGLAFDSQGKLIVSNRAEGEVVQINNDSEVVPLAGDLGIATGIAFNSDGTLFVGDRSGTIYRISSLGDAESWAILEPSVSAYHIAFGPDGSLFVAAPGLCSYDVIYKIDSDGNEEIFYKGLGRPQGMAFDESGNLYAAACMRGRHGIVRISADGNEAEIFVSGVGVVGLCFTREGKMLVATNDALYRIDMEIRGTLLQ